MARILDGKETAAALETELKERLEALRKAGKEPQLAILLVGDSKPSVMYTAFMQKQAAGYGIPVRLVKLPQETTEAELLGKIGELNRDPGITGILMMMPLPPQIDGERAVEAIDPDKDIDGLTTPVWDGSPPARKGSSRARPGPAWRSSAITASTRTACARWCSAGATWWEARWHSSCSGPTPP